MINNSEHERQMAYIDFLSVIHKSTKRDYVARVVEFPKAEAAALAKQWGVDYWDGDRKTGYGGLCVRWPVAEGC